MNILCNYPAKNCPEHTVVKYFPQKQLFVQLFPQNPVGVALTPNMMRLSMMLKIST